MRTLESLARSEKARRILDAIAGAGRALSPPEILERVPGNWNDGKQLLDAALAGGLVTRQGFGKRARYAIAGKAYGVWLAETLGTENGTENGTEFPPASLPSLRSQRSETAAAARLSFPEQLRTENRVTALLREILALVSETRTGNEGETHPEVRSSPQALPPLDPARLALRERIVKREARKNPAGFREIVHRRLEDPEYVRVKTKELEELRESKAVAPSPSPSSEEVAARAERERVGAARAKLLAIAPAALAEYERVSVELAQEELGPAAKELRVRMRAVEIANAFVLEHVAKLVG